MKRVKQNASNDITHTLRPHTHTQRNNTYIHTQTPTHRDDKTNLRTYNTHK
jgi:hypothetical protein